MTQTVAPARARRPGPAPVLARLAVSDRFWGWVAPLLVMLVGGVLRFWRLDQPHQVVFDETYYVKEGASYLRVGYELATKPIPSGSPDPFNTGTAGVWGTAGSFVVHPPVGKWMIAAGEWLFGPTSSFGWRFASALCGTLAILMIGRIARRLFGSTLLGTTAALLLAVDGQEFVHSRTGILDIFVMFWALAAFGALLIDRDQTRRRLVDTTRDLPDRPTFGPWTGLRPWRITGIIALALCTGVKWSGLYFTAAFLLLSFCWDVSARRAAGVRHWLPGAAFVDGVQAFGTLAVVLPSVYLASWTGWFASSRGYDRQWAASHPAEPGWGWVPDVLRSLRQYHGEMWRFHVNLETAHPYMSNPWSWMILGRPTAFFFDKASRGTHGCRTASECARAVTALGNPVIWWGGTLALGVLLYSWVLARDWRAGAVLAGFAGGYLPWFLYQQRTIFTFYAVAFVPWVVLGLTYTLGLVLGPPGLPEQRRRHRALAAGSVVFLAVVAFWFFYPVLSAQQVPYGAWLARMWFPSWI